MALTGAISVNDAVEAAQRAMAAGRMDEAARAWQRVLSAAPNHPQALFFFGRRAMATSDAAAARDLFRRAAAAAPNEAMIRVNLALAHAALGEADAQMNALDDALAVDPYCYPALLMKAAALEKAGQSRDAARLFKNALTVLPNEATIPPDLKGLVAHGRQAVRENADAFDAFLRQRLGAARARHGDGALTRFDACKDVMVGTKRVFTPAPTMLHYPGLPAIEFYERADFPWLENIERETETIRGELINLLKERETDFRPYVHHPEGVPLNQWAELNNSMKWSSLFLWEDGKRIAENCASCPRTAAALEAAPLCRIPGYAPAAFFSALQPGAHIPAHTGVTNARLIVHLPLIVPGECYFRVGNDKRAWREGEAWVFDDTMEHEAWNNSDKLRVIFIFDIWNPHLSEAERELVCELLSAFREYYHGQGAGDWT